MQSFSSLTVFILKLTYQEILWFSGIYVILTTLQRFLLLHQSNDTAIFLNDIFLLYIVIFLVYGNLMEKIRRDSAFEWLRSIGISINLVSISLDICIFTVMIAPLCALIGTAHMLNQHPYSLFFVLLISGINFLAISHLCYGDSSKVSFLRLIIVPIPVLLPLFICAQGFYEQSNTSALWYLLAITMIDCGVLALQMTAKQK